MSEKHTVGPAEEAYRDRIFVLMAQGLNVIRPSLNWGELEKRCSTREEVFDVFLDILDAIDNSKNYQSLKFNDSYVGEMTDIREMFKSNPCDEVLLNPNVV